MVLMNSPTICSTSGISAGRPDTVAPKTTSCCPVIRDRYNAHPAWISVFSVTPAPRARPPSAPVSALPSSRRTEPGIATARPLACGAISVGPPTPASAPAHAASAASRSQPASQSRYRATGATGARPASLPPARYKPSNSPVSTGTDQPSHKM